MALERFGGERPEHPFTPLVFSGKLMGILAHGFCSGCGYPVIAQAITRVFAEENLDPKKYPFFIGIGCYSMLPTILPSYCVMCLHGRPIPAAFGAKMANPELKPIIIGGDGDTLSIGTCHFIHGCRRNFDGVLLILHNNVYGMTGGQLAPTTPQGYKATTAPYGMIEPDIDPVKLAIQAGASYVARWSSLHPVQFYHSFRYALLEHRGFAVIDVITTCPTLFGRLNGMENPMDLRNWWKQRLIPKSRAQTMPPEELKDKLVVGEFFNNPSKPEFCQKYYDFCKQLMGK